MSIKNILRTVIASGFVIGTAAVLSPAAFAVDTSGAAQSGAITAIETVSYTAGTSVTIVPDTLQTDEDFGSVNVQSNDNAGWTLAVASTNGSILKHATIANASIAYTLKVDGIGVVVSTPATPVQAIDVAVLTSAQTGGDEYLVEGSIAAAASAGKPAGTYSDTLTFSLTNK